MDSLEQIFTAIQAWAFEYGVEPLFYSLGLSAYLEMAYDAVQIVLIGLCEITLLYVVLRPLEALWPVENWFDRRALRVDVIYTWLQRVGVLPLIFFFLLTPLLSQVDEWLRMHDLIPLNLEDWVPGLRDYPLLTFAVYLIVLDFTEYWRHRLQHRLSWWWALHSLHHSQAQLSFWADDRNHLFDSLLANLWFAFISLVIGVPPAQFILILVLTRVLQSVAHSNIRLSLGPVFSRLLVAPQFHRVHHGVGVGHEGRAAGCNFGVLLPIWDIVFRTANFTHTYFPTGIRDQGAGRAYGEGFWRQQVLGAQRLIAALRRRAQA
jgi:sterol desaturase/sphingolipid hydroxylase (fatty acid hydroxylase superfamily)